MRQFSARILSNEQLCQSMYQVRLQGTSGTETGKPGQFLTVRITQSVVPLLRRPFALSHNEPEDRFSFIYQVRGAGTDLLSTFGRGTELDIIGPLGIPFPLPAPGEFSLLVAGGIGLGPILFLADTLRHRGCEFSFVFGCRSAAFFPEAVFENHDTVVCTDDGSSGFSGNVVEYLESVSGELSLKTRIYCCGPEPMLKGCHQFAGRHGFLCHVSVEQVMACGVGACMGCAVRLADTVSYARACREGPVFDSRELAWD
ncbi:MAG: dihydroorotate dehydrogenase electron transfer subunit [Chitinispirillaceae bacterium]|nr:dihydroorotate dehydrogenase electron transfer subunit [Chitinispirillaceae bacterium]